MDALKSRFSKRSDTKDQTPYSDSDNEKDVVRRADEEPVRLLRFRIIAMALIVSMGGTIFGYDTGQISGFVQMQNFIDSFADDPTASQNQFSHSREGTIVGLLSIGTLIGSLCAGPVADRLGRRVAVVFWNIIFCVGVIVQISTPGVASGAPAGSPQPGSWVQIAMGRWVAGLGVGGLSVMTPMYQAETAPKQIRGAMICCYQLFITFGIFLADCINYGTKGIDSPASWRIPLGIGFIFPVIMAVGIMSLSESPRWDFRHGRIDRATASIATSYGVPQNHSAVQFELREIREKFEAENVGGPHPWYEIFTGPRMAYRTILGLTLQSLQQLTGANFFFYYGTSIFASVGLSDSFITAIILGLVNFVSTFAGLYVVEHFGRRRALITGALWCFMCFMVFASVGHFLFQQGKETSTAGGVMIAFACLFIVGYAVTWGPIIWALVGEIYPSRYRAKAMGVATSANWTWNFLIAFFTPYITDAIDYRYGYVFAASLFLGAVVVYLFVGESQGRTLEEIDTMYVLEIPAWKTTGWVAPADMAGLTDNAYLDAGARHVSKAEQGTGGDTDERKESVSVPEIKG